MLPSNAPSSKPSYPPLFPRVLSALRALFLLKPLALELQGSSAFSDCPNHVLAGPVLDLSFDPQRGGPVATPRPLPRLLPRPWWSSHLVAPVRNWIMASAGGRRRRSLPAQGAFQTGMPKRGAFGDRISKSTLLEGRVSGFPVSESNLFVRLDDPWCPRNMSVCSECLSLRRFRPRLLLAAPTTKATIWPRLPFVYREKFPKNRGVDRRLTLIPGSAR